MDGNGRDVMAKPVHTSRRDGPGLYAAKAVLELCLGCVKLSERASQVFDFLFDLLLDLGKLLDFQAVDID